MGLPSVLESKVAGSASWRLRCFGSVVARLGWPVGLGHQSCAWLCVGFAWPAAAVRVTRYRTSSTLLPVPFVFLVVHVIGATVACSLHTVSDVMYIRAAWQCNDATHTEPNTM